MMNGTQAHNSKVSLLILLTLFVLSACGGDTTNTNTPPVDNNVPTVMDTTPEPFSFPSTTDQALNTLVTSDEITVTGINYESVINIVGGEYSIDGGDFSNLPSTVTNQQVVAVRLLSSEHHTTTHNLTITIGDVSETFSATTHGPLTKLANEFSSDINAKFSIISQPVRGRIITSADLSKLTYQPLNSFDYLSAGETAQETVSIAILGEPDNTHELTFTITGEDKSEVCESRNIIDILPAEVNQTATNIAEGDCVQLDASKLGDGYWAVWAGENGAARYYLLPTLGLERTQAKITFLPPTKGSYSFAWCVPSGSCLQSYNFFSDMPNTEQALDVRLTVPNIHPEDEIFLTIVNDEVNKDTSGYSYHWIIHDWNNGYRKLIDVVTSQGYLSLPAPSKNNNYWVTLIVDDNVTQLEGGFTSTSSDLYGKIKLNVNTLGNYKILSDVVIARPESSTEKPPFLVVILEGDSTRYQWNEDALITVEAQLGTTVVFDFSETVDENGDELSFYINGTFIEGDSKRFSVEATTDAYYNICVSDGFPWIDEENPCLIFDVLIK